MSGYSINTLFGDNPVVTVVEPLPQAANKFREDFVAGAPSAKIWSVVVQRERDGKVVQKDTTGNMDLIEAITHANNMRAIYRLDGFTEDEGRFMDPTKPGEYVFVFVL